MADANEGSINERLPDGVERHLDDDRCKYRIYRDESPYYEIHQGTKIYTEKRLVRDCYCGYYEDRWEDRGSTTPNGDGYEIHYNNQCRYIPHSYEARNHDVKKLIRHCVCGAYDNPPPDPSVDVNEP